MVEAGDDVHTGFITVVSYLRVRLHISTIKAKTKACLGKQLLKLSDGHMRFPIVLSFLCVCVCVCV